MYDLDEEHTELYNEEEIHFIKKITSQFETLINILYQLQEFYYTSFAVDVFRLEGRTPEEAMKDTIYQYYQLFHKPEHKVRDGNFLDNELYGNQVKADSIEECLKNVLEVDDEKIHKMPVGLRKEFVETLSKSVNNLNIIFHGNFPKLYAIPKECKCFHSRVVSTVYLGLIFRGSYLVYNDCCIMVIYGTSE